MAAGLLTLLAVALRTITSPDFWMRLATGRHIAAEGIPRTDVFMHNAADVPWVNTAWLYDRIVFELWGWGGAPLIILLHAGMLGAAFVLLARLARPWASPPAMGLALTLSVWVLLFSYSVGPAVPGLFLAALFAYILRHEFAPRRHLPLLVPLQILWANLSPSFLLGPLIITLAFSGALTAPSTAGTHRRPGQNAYPIQTLALGAGALMLATCLNPFFLSTHRAALSMLLRPPPQADLGLIAPLSPYFARPLSSYAFIASIPLLALGIVSQKGRLPLLLAGLAFATAFSAFRDIGTLPYYAALAFPFMALSIQAVGETVSSLFLVPRPPPWLRTANIVLPIAALLGSAVWIGSGNADRAAGHLSRPGLSADTRPFPSSAADWVSRSPEQTVFHLPFDAGYLAWTLPAPSLFADSRRERHSPERAELIHRWLSGEPESMSELDRALAPSAMVISCLWPGGASWVRARLREHTWSLESFDGVTAVLQRKQAHSQPEHDHHRNRDAAHASFAVLLQDIQDAQEYVQQGKRPAFSPRLIGAALFFTALEQDREALEMLDLVQAASPRMTYAQLLRGISLLRTGQPEAALDQLKPFTRRNPKNRQGWVWLAQTHQALGNKHEARQAIERARAINAQTEPPRLESTGAGGRAP